MTCVYSFGCASRKDASICHPKAPCKGRIDQYLRVLLIFATSTCWWCGSPEGRVCSYPRRQEAESSMARSASGLLQGTIVHSANIYSMYSYHGSFYSTSTSPHVFAERTKPENRPMHPEACLRNSAKGRSSS